MKPHYLRTDRRTRPRRTQELQSELLANRRGDLILRFGPAQADFKAVIPASCVLSKEQGWIESLKNRKLTVCGLLAFMDRRPCGSRKTSDSLAARLKANLKTTLAEMLSKASHAHCRKSLSTRDAAARSGRNLVPKRDLAR